MLLGSGQGALAPATTVATGGTKPSAVALADLNSDGKLDVIVANDWATNVSVLLGDGAGGLTAAPKSPFPTDGPSGASAIAVGNFNGDAKTRRRGRRTSASGGRVGDARGRPGRSRTARPGSPTS